MKFNDETLLENTGRGGGGGGAVRVRLKHHLIFSGKKIPLEMNFDDETHYETIHYREFKNGGKIGTHFVELNQLT